MTLDTSTTQWQVLQAVYDTNGHPLQFAANFTSLDASGNVDLQGEVRFHSDLPLRGSVELAADTFQGNASDSGITVDVEHVGDTSEPVSVQYSTSDYSAVKGIDYVKTMGTLTWAAGDASTKTFTVPLLQHAPAGDRVFFVRLKGGSLDKVTNAGVTIADNTFTAANARPEPDGQVDPGYAVALTNSSQVYLPVIRPQQDGSTLIGGTFGAVKGQAQPGIARLDSRGVPDFTFHSPLSASAESQVNTIVTQPDGKILVAGRLTLANGTTVGICRLNADGSLDTEFAQLPALAEATVYAIALQTDGRLVVAGTFSLPNGLARLNADGTVDTSFKPPVVDYLLDYEFVVLQPDGRLIVGDAYNKIMRLKSDGGVDASFHPAFGTGFGFGGSNVVLQPDGKLILPPQTSQGQLVRFNHDGTLDTTFNVLSSAFAGAYGISSLALQPDGKLLLGLAVYSPGTAGIVRLNADGAVDTTFNLASMGLPESVGTLALAPDGRLLVSAGSVSTTGNGVVHEILARLGAVTPGVGTPGVTVGASVSTAIRSIPQDGQFTLTRTGDLSRKLVVSYTVKGDAVAGVDYVAVSGKQKFRAGQDTATIKIVPLAGASGGEQRKLKLRLSPADGYTLGNATMAKVTIIDAP